MTQYLHNSNANPGMSPIILYFLMIKQYMCENISLRFLTGFKAETFHTNSTNKPVSTLLYHVTARRIVKPVSSPQSDTQQTCSHSPAHSVSLFKVSALDYLCSQSRNLPQMLTCSVFHHNEVTLIAQLHRSVYQSSTDHHVVS